MILGKLGRTMGKLTDLSKQFKVLTALNHSLSDADIRIVDYSSDTKSLPTLEMRKAIFQAKVGDDGYGEDLSTNVLQEKISKMLGKEAALYVPSGTMANLIAIMTHCEKRGSEVIVGSGSHILLNEQAGAALIGGIQLRPVSNKSDGTFDIDEMLGLVRNHKLQRFLPTTALVCVENTHNSLGGRITPISWLRELSTILRAHEIPLHMDGSRLFNSVVASGVPADEIVKDCDSINVCLSKGLGGPVGSLLIGSQAFINRAKFLRKVLGGGMRQIGFATAAGIYALDNSIERLKDDHTHTKALAKAIHDAQSKIISVNLNSVETNILVIHLDPSVVDSAKFAQRLLTVTEEDLKNEIRTSIKILPRTPDIARAVICLNNTNDDLEAAVKKIQFVIKEFDQNVCL